MIVDIAIAIIAAAAVVFVVLVVPVLMRLRQIAEEAEGTLHRINQELPILLPEITRTVRTLNTVTADLRQTVAAVRPFGEVAGTIGNTIQETYGSLHGGATAIATTAKRWLAGIRAAYDVLQNGSRHTGTAWTSDGSSTSRGFRG
ncbi:MAG: DUF948 domain-containing protein [Nitrospirae bacterium]|nr:MAG: DUF948 domain-containing protein [Nitrospirota bacterium]